MSKSKELLIRISVLIAGIFIIPFTSHADYRPPLEHFKKYYSSPGTKEIWKLEVDINKDGKDEIFLTQDNSRNAKAGHMWSVYRWVPVGHYSMQSGIRSFRTDAFYVGEISEFGEYGLLTYHPDGGGSGSLILLKYEEMIVVEKKLKTIEPGENPEDSALYDKYFPNKNKHKIQKIKFAPVKAELKINGPIPYLDLEIFMKGLGYSNKLVPKSIRENNPSKDFIEKWTAEARQGEPVIYKDYNQDGFDDFRFELKYARGVTGNMTFLLFAGAETGYSYAGMMAEPVLSLHYKESNNTYFVEYAKSGPEGYFDLTRLEGNQLKKFAQITFTRNSFPKISAEISEKELLSLFNK